MMRKHCVGKFLIILSLSCSLLQPGMVPEAAAQRGISVRLKASDDPRAPVVEEVELYSASYALVIGNDDYRNGWPRLSNAISDANDVAETLQKKGFEVTFKKNLTSKELKTAFEEFFIFKGDNPEARLFVWFAGHGHTIGGNGFIVPVDAPSPREGPKFKYMALSMQRFGEFVRMASSKHTYAVFDSCFAGTIFDTRRNIPPVAITRMVTYPVRQFLTSGDSDQAVSDDGRFCKLFLRAINGEEKADANRDGYLTGTELGNFLTDRITNLTHAKQTPRYGKFLDEDYDRGDFVFLLPQVEILQTKSIVTIDSNVPDARVLVDGKYIGKTNLKEAIVPPGKHRLRIEKKGYRSHVQSALFKEGKEMVLYIHLISNDPPQTVTSSDSSKEIKQAKAALYLEVGPKDAVVKIENIKESFYQGMLLPAGQYQLVVSAEGHKPQSKWINLKSGEKKHIPIELEWAEPSAVSQTQSAPTRQKKKSRTLPAISF